MAPAVNTGYLAPTSSSSNSASISCSARDQQKEGKITASTGLHPALSEPYDAIAHSVYDTLTMKNIPREADGVILHVPAMSAHAANYTGTHPFLPRPYASFNEFIAHISNICTRTTDVDVAKTWIQFFVLFHRVLFDFRSIEPSTTFVMASLSFF